MAQRRNFNDLIAELNADRNAERIEAARDFAEQFNPVREPRPDGDAQAELVEWLEEQTWSDFAQDLAYAYQRWGRLTERQEAAARSMRTKVEAREQRRRGGEGFAPTDLDLSDVPAGRYAVPGGDTRLKIKIDKPENGKWAGWVFVKDAAEYGQGNRYGSQKPGGTYRGDIQDALAAIAADPFEASKAYGKLVGQCGVCGRHLEDAESVAKGIGPICEGRFS